MRPKLTLTDLDGTLLRDDKTVSAANLAALERAAAAGCEIVVATDRVLRAVPQVLLDLPFLRYFILMNGAQVLDRKTGEVLSRCEIPADAAAAVFALLEGVNCSVDCYQNGQGLMSRRQYDRMADYIRDPAALALTRSTRRPVEDLSAAVRSGGSVQKIQLYFPDLSLRAPTAARLRRAFPQLLQSTSMPGNLELNAAGADKGSALLALCRVLGLDPSEAAAFGDGTNDVSMLRAAGTGVAMANAAPETLAAANLTAPSNQEDGVAQILNRWFAP